MKRTRSLELVKPEGTESRRGRLAHILQRTLGGGLGRGGRRLLPLLLGAAWGHAASAAPVPKEVPWCGTSRAGVVISDALHRQHERRLAREKGLDKAARLPQASSAGSIAVITDDGGLIAPAASFDLTGSLQFATGPRKATAAASGAVFDSEMGSPVTLGDDTSVPVAFTDGFSFPFFGHTYTSLFVNSDGNLTFGEAEPQSDREVPTFLAGPPRIAPFFADLDPSSASADGGVFVRTAADRVVVTWLNIPGYGSRDINTFQVTLLSDGQIVFSYPTMRSGEAIVGVSPGHGTKIDLIDYSTELPFAAGPVGGPIALAERFGFVSYIDEFRIAKAFFSRFADAYDHLLVFVDFPVDLGGGFAYEVSPKNEVQGLGTGTFDYSEDFGSHGRLRAFVMLSSLAHFPDDPDQTFLATNSTMDVMGQEAGHRWLAFLHFRGADGKPSDALLGRDLAHWSFKHDTQASDMEGNEIRDNGDGSFLTTASTERYSPLDQYAMGLIPASAVPPFFYVDGGSSDTIAAGRHPETGVSFTGTRHDVTIDDVIAVEGEREPSSDKAPKSFKMAFILIEPAGGHPSRASLAKVDRIRRRWSPYFHTATDGHATVDTRLFLRR